MMTMFVSIITPVYNEESSVSELVAQISEVMRAGGIPFEIIAVDDGSQDRSREVLRAAMDTAPELTVVELARNYGQTAAMQAAIDIAKGDIIVPIDADLQNNPKDILRLIDKLNEGYDLVSGWRKDRKDSAIRRNWVSSVANRLISKVSGVQLHDYGCSLKAYRREILEGVRLYGEMHRFIPIYASWYGCRIGELPVDHSPRRAGESKYGLERTFKVLLDLLVVRFLQGPMSKPIYWFGGVGLFFIALGLICAAWALSLKFLFSVSFILTPLPIVTMMALMLGVICFLIGLLAEMQVRIYYEAQNKCAYHVRVIHRST